MPLEKLCLGGNSLLYSLTKELSYVFKSSGARGLQSHLYPLLKGLLLAHTHSFSSPFLTSATSVVTPFTIHSSFFFLLLAPCTNPLLHGFNKQNLARWLLWAGLINQNILFDLFYLFLCFSAGVVNATIMMQKA